MCVGTGKKENDGEVKDLVLSITILAPGMVKSCNI